MQISVTDAKAQLTELVRRAGAGEEVVFTRHGQATVRLVPVVPVVNAATRRALIEDVQASVAARRALDLTFGAGTSTARSQDFLYDEFGLPA